jgi:hypothetical protein
MAAPMIILYECCIWLAWFDAKKQRQAEEAEERERMERLLTDRNDQPEPEGEAEAEGGEEEDRGDPWDPSSSEEGWKAGQEVETPSEQSDEPPESIPGEEKRRMTDL